MTTTTPSERTPERLEKWTEVGGIRVQLRILCSEAAKERFDASGTSLLQFRGTIQDTTIEHPECVVRFSGQRQSELKRWAAPGKHLSVDGYMEVKVWTDKKSGMHRVSLLVMATSVFPLRAEVTDLSKIGVYSRSSHPTSSPTVAKPAQAPLQLLRAAMANDD